MRQFYAWQGQTAVGKEVLDAFESITYVFLCGIDGCRDCGLDAVPHRCGRAFNAVPYTADCGSDAVEHIRYCISDAVYDRGNRIGYAVDDCGNGVLYAVPDVSEEGLDARPHLLPGGSYPSECRIQYAFYGFEDGSKKRNQSVPQCGKDVLYGVPGAFPVTAENGNEKVHGA